MITADTRVADALAARPELRDVLPAFHPAFARLRHPILGRVLPRLVTVREAARIVGVDPDALVAVMNLPRGATVPVAVSAERSPPSRAPAWLLDEDERALDVTAMLDRGEEPLPRILDALRALAPGEVLTVVAPFEPVPLIGLLARQGWSHHVLWDGDVCRVSFARVADPAVPEVAADLGARLAADGPGWRLDVRDLPPPEPMRAVLAAIDRGALPLRVVHRREPVLLYAHLADRGLTWETRAAEGAVEIRIDVA